MLFAVQGHFSNPSSMWHVWRRMRTKSPRRTSGSIEWRCQLLKRSQDVPNLFFVEGTNDLPTNHSEGEPALGFRTQARPVECCPYSFMVYSQPGIQPSNWRKPKNKNTISGKRWRCHHLWIYWGWEDWNGCGPRAYYWWMPNSYNSFLDLLQHLCVKMKPLLLWQLENPCDWHWNSALIDVEFPRTHWPYVEKIILPKGSGLMDGLWATTNSPNGPTGGWDCQAPTCRNLMRRDPPKSSELVPHLD